MLLQIIFYLIINQIMLYNGIYINYLKSYNTVYMWPQDHNPFEMLGYRKYCNLLNNIIAYEYCVHTYNINTTKTLIKNISKTSYHTWPIYIICIGKNVYKYSYFYIMKYGKQYVYIFYIHNKSSVYTMELF